MKYFRWTITALLIIGAYTEAGIFTAVCLAHLAIGIELMQEHVQSGYRGSDGYTKKLEGLLQKVLEDSRHGVVPRSHLDRIRAALGKGESDG